MKKIRYIVLINVVLVAIWLVARNTTTKTTEYSLNMTVASDVSSGMIEEAKEAFRYIPEPITNAFSDNDWKIVLLRDFKEEEGYEHIGSDSTIVGLIRYSDKTIIIRGDDVYTNAARDITIHELCHYAHRYFLDNVQKDELEQLYSMYKDGGFVTFSYAGILVTEEYRTDIMYATSTIQEFFAETMKDYLLHPEYLEENYHEIYEYFRLLFLKNKWN